MADLIEDPDGAPYPPEAQELWQLLIDLQPYGSMRGELHDAFVAAMESVKG